MLPPEKYALKLLSLSLLTVVLVMILSGCITKPPAILNGSYQENLLKKCASVLPPLTGKTGRDLSITLTDLAMMYGQCAARHNQLSDEINQRRDLSHD